MGAVATGGVRVLNDQIVAGLRIPDHLIEEVAAAGTAGAGAPGAPVSGRSSVSQDLRGRTVISSTTVWRHGATMLAAVKALRALQPARIVVAVPTGSPETCEQLKAEADDVVCAITPEPFHAVGLWYEDFTQTTDDEVRDLLARAAMATQAA